MGFILQFLSLVGLYLFYYPPKHPRGVPWRDALRGLDYVGTLLVIPGICLVLVGIINTTVSYLFIFVAVQGLIVTSTNPQAMSLSLRQCVSDLAFLSCLDFGKPFQSEFKTRIPRTIRANGCINSVKYPLCPPHIFRYHNGREFTVPFILAFIV